MADNVHSHMEMFLFYRRKNVTIHSLLGFKKEHKVGIVKESRSFWYLICGRIGIIGREPVSYKAEDTNMGSNHALRLYNEYEKFLDQNEELKSRFF